MSRMISVIVPVLNESKSVVFLHEELLAALRSIGMPFEIIFVDDGSTDGTLEALKALKPARVIALTRNFGKTQALQAGFRAAGGDYIFTIDGDLQDNPAEMPKFLETMEERGADLVCGWKQNRRDSFAKRAVSKAANELTRLFTGSTVHDMNCGFKLYRRNLAQSLELYGDMHRYIPAIASGMGFRVAEVPVAHRQRQFGVSKFGNFRRFSKSFFDFITLLLVRRFMDRPMHFFGTIGLLLLAVGTAILAYLAYVRLFTGELIGDRPILLLGVLLAVIGVQLFSSGFLGEILIRGGRGASYTVREEREEL